MSDTRAPIDLVEGRDFTITRRTEPVIPRVPVARAVARPRKPKPPKMKLTTRDPLTMAAVGLAALALEWWLNPADDDEYDDDR